MSAPNFAKNNAEDYYCVGMNREEDEWIDWDEMREDIFQVAKAESDFWSKDDSWEHGYGRDYQLHHAAERSYSMTYGGETYYAILQLPVERWQQPPGGHLAHRQWGIRHAAQPRGR